MNVDDDEGTAENPRTPTYEPTDKNTGYYVCGFTNQSATVDTNRDITLTYYGSTNAAHTAEGGKIVESFGSTTTPYNQATLHDIQTIKSNNGALSVEPIEGHESEYTRYASASKSLQKVLRSDSNVYGMHFVNKAHTGDISKNAVVRATNVSLLGQTYPYYDLPVHSIDFNLEKQGYITFLSGVYSGSNKADTGVDSFFSLHQVVRAQGDVTTITDVKRISQIYVNTDTSENAPPYVYKYSDSNSYSTGTPGDLIFDTATIGDVDSKISDWRYERYDY